MRPTTSRGVPAAGWRTVELDAPRRLLRLAPGCRLDLGATAKALAADRAAAAIAAATGSPTLVNLGGDVATAGPVPPGGWLVRVTDDHRAGPDADGQRVAVLGGGLATSSTTVRRWRRAGRDVHHIVDPRTGEPARGGVADGQRRRRLVRGRQHGEHGGDRARSVRAALARVPRPARAARRSGGGRRHGRRLARGRMILAAAGPSPLWYLSRGTGAITLVLLSATVLLGISGTLRWRPGMRTPRFVVDGLHRNVSLLVVVLLAAHILTAVLDPFAHLRVLDAVVPFASHYRPLWLGFGALAFDLLLALIVTSLLRARLGLRAWRAVHWAAYLCWPVAVLHGLGTGTDARSVWLQALTAVCVGAVVIALAARLLRDWPRAGAGCASAGWAWSPRPWPAAVVFAAAGAAGRGLGTPRRHAGHPAGRDAHAGRATSGRRPARRFGSRSRRP